MRRFIRQTAMLGLDIEAAQEASRIMGTLLRLGQPVNALDVLISGIAVANNAESIVTFDRDFERIEKVADIRVQLF